MSYINPTSSTPSDRTSPPKIGRVACVELFASEISKCWFIVVHAPAYDLLGQRHLGIIIVRNVRLFCSFLFFVRKG
jgi:hypothetical protein